MTILNPGLAIGGRKDRTFTGMVQADAQTVRPYILLMFIVDGQAVECWLARADAKSRVSPHLIGNEGVGCFCWADEMRQGVDLQFIAQTDAQTVRPYIRLIMRILSILVGLFLVEKQKKLGKMGKWDCGRLNFG